MPKKIKNKKNSNYKDRNRNNQLHHVSNGGISTNKWNNNRINNTNNRKNYITPKIIEALEKDEDLENIHNSQNHSPSPNPNKKKNKKNRQKTIQNLQNNEAIQKVRTKFTIGDDDDELKKHLLPSKPHCRLASIPEDVFNVIVSYVQNYFTCFDTNREGLVGAYNPKCLFSLSLNLQNPVGHRFFKFDDSLVKESRNLKRIFKTDHQTNEKKYRLIKKGHLETTSFLFKLPPTEHEPNSFKLDQCFFTPNLISFCVTGVFREGKPEDNVRPLRCFQRVFVCIADTNSQMSIVNEQLIISNLTTDQYKLYYEAQMKNSEINKLNNGEPLVNTTNVIDPKNQMLEQFSLESGLNLEWAKYCLDHAGWNYEEAVKSFLQFKESIPKEGFRKS
ncbi:unnamed protein product [Brachionus calyciflorus]|uniref:Nuclear RNA export factor 1 n=1 Tax=Brachionus calyciflorus TaxID=104777 RepID=A0A814PD47_9BILA|nr:unnamed protein product [Brachionus calyciflorus]